MILCAADEADENLSAATLFGRWQVTRGRPRTLMFDTHAHLCAQTI